MLKDPSLSGSKLARALEFLLVALFMMWGLGRPLQMHGFTRVVSSYLFTGRLGLPVSIIVVLVLFVFGLKLMLNYH